MGLIDIITEKMAFDYADLVRKWIDLLQECSGRVIEIEDFYKLSEVLGRLCIEARNLPQLEISHISDRDIEYASIVRELSLHINEKYQRYYALFFPYEGTASKEGEADNPVMGSLLEDYYDITLDLCKGLQFFKKGNYDYALYWWGFLYSEHWGEHASQALYAMDHVIREHMSMVRFGEAESTRLPVFPVVSFMDVLGYGIVRISSEDTHLVGDILLHSIKKPESIIPFLGVLVDGCLVSFVSISDKPRDLSEFSFDGLDQILRWVSKNSAILLKHWNRKITDKEVCEMVSRPV